MHVYMLERGVNVAGLIVILLMGKSASLVEMAFLDLPGAVHHTSTDTKSQ